MNWNDVKFDEYDKEIPCVNCKKVAKPTVAGDNFKCNPCGHLFREDGTKPEMECTCLKCNPGHDPLKGKTKGKKAELVMDDELEESSWGHTCLDHPDSDRFCGPDCRKVPVDKNGKPLKPKSKKKAPTKKILRRKTKRLRK